MSDLWLIRAEALQIDFTRTGKPLALAEEITDLNREF